MSVKYVKVRFNTDNARDMEIYSELNGMDGQNRFIKEAVRAYLNRKSDDELAESIAAALLPKLGKIRFEAPYSHERGKAPHSGRGQGLYRRVRA